MDHALDAMQAAMTPRDYFRPCTVFTAFPSMMFAGTTIFVSFLLDLSDILLKILNIYYW